MGCRAKEGCSRSGSVTKTKIQIAAETSLTGIQQDSNKWSMGLKTIENKNNLRLMVMTDLNLVQDQDPTINLTMIHQLSRRRDPLTQDCKAVWKSQGISILILEWCREAMIKTKTKEKSITMKVKTWGRTMIWAKMKMRAWCRATPIHTQGDQTNEASSRDLSK